LIIDSWPDNQADNTGCRGHEPAAAIGSRADARIPRISNGNRLLTTSPSRDGPTSLPLASAACHRAYGARVRLRARCPLSAARIASARALTTKGTVPLAGDSQVQDRDSHCIHGLGLLWALTGSKNAGSQDVLLVSGSRIFPDTEEVTSSNLVPPTAFPHVIAEFRHDVR
jgi:hypothetical protein